MFEEFKEHELELLQDMGYIIVEGIARQGHEIGYETLRIIDGKVYHAGKDQSGSRFDKTYDNFDMWYEDKQKQ